HGRCQELPPDAIRVDDLTGPARELPGGLREGPVDDAVHQLLGRLAVVPVDLKPAPALPAGGQLGEGGPMVGPEEDLKFPPATRVAGDCQDLVEWNLHSPGFINAEHANDAEFQNQGCLIPE